MAYLLQAIWRTRSLWLRASVRKSLYADQVGRMISQFKTAMQFQFGAETWLRWFEKLA